MTMRPGGPAANARAALVLEEVGHARAPLIGGGGAREGTGRGTELLLLESSAWLQGFQSSLARRLGDC